MFKPPGYGSQRKPVQVPECSLQPSYTSGGGVVSASPLRAAVIQRAAVNRSPEPSLEMLLDLPHCPSSLLLSKQAVAFTLGSHHCLAFVASHHTQLLKLGSTPTL